MQFVFEEDLDIPKAVMEKVKRHLFDHKVPKDISAAREALVAKAKTYYSSEALNPRPKRGRPPKQVVKIETEPQVTADMYTTVPQPLMQFLYLPEITSASSVTFSARYDTEAQLLASLRGSSRVKVDAKLQALSERLESLRHLSSRLTDIQEITGSDREDKLIRQVNLEAEVSDEELEEPGKGKKILDVVKEFLPKKREKEPKAAKQEGQLPQPPKKPSVKTVTQIQKKYKK